jgi:hypothetical protein
MILGCGWLSPASWKGGAFKDFDAIRIRRGYRGRRRRRVTSIVVVVRGMWIVAIGKVLRNRAGGRPPRGHRRVTFAWTVKSGIRVDKTSLARKRGIAVGREYKRRTWWRPNVHMGIVRVPPVVQNRGWGFGFERRSCDTSTTESMLEAQDVR